MNVSRVLHMEVRVTRTIRAMAIWAAAILGAGCGGKTGQSPDGGRGDDAQAGGADGHGPADAAMDMLSPLDAADVPPGSDAADAADAPPGGDAADAPPGSDAATDAVGTGPDGGNLPGLWYELGGSATGEGLDPGTSDNDPVIGIDVAGHPLVA